VGFETRVAEPGRERDLDIWSTGEEVIANCLDHIAALSPAHAILSPEFHDHLV
jgi:hypothetical protein